MGTTAFCSEGVQVGFLILVLHFVFLFVVWAVGEMGCVGISEENHVVMAAPRSSQLSKKTYSVRLLRTESTRDDQSPVLSAFPVESVIKCAASWAAAQRVFSEDSSRSFRNGFF